MNNTITENYNTVTEIKNTLEGINNRINKAEEWISELEDRLVEITVAEQNKERRMKRDEDSLRNQHSHYTGPRRRERKELRKYLKR